jgi:hypothetical protein
MTAFGIHLSGIAGNIIGNLSDVTIGSPGEAIGDNHVLQYSSSSGVWENRGCLTIGPNSKLFLCENVGYPQIRLYSAGNEDTLGTGYSRFQFGVSGSGGLYVFRSKVSGDGAGGSILPITIYADNATDDQLYLNTVGEVGIRCIPNGYDLDVGGTLRAQGLGTFSAGLTCTFATIDSYTLNEVATPKRLQISVADTTLVLGFSTAACEGTLSYSGIVGGFTLNGDLAVGGYISTTEYIDIPETTSTTVGVISRSGAPFIMAPQGIAVDRLNTFIGTNVGNTALTGYSNYCIGENVGESLTSGFSNVAMGYRAASSLTEGDNNVFLGREAGFKVTTGVSNFALGFFALAEVTTGSGNVAIGAQAGQYLTVTTASDNICIGRLSGKVTASGANNIFIGKQSGGSAGADFKTSYAICLGYYAGGNQTGWNIGRLCIGSYNQGANEATDTIIYGEMKQNSPSTQTLALNAVTTVSQTFITTNGRKKKTSRYTTTQPIPLTDNVVYLNGTFTATLPASPPAGQTYRLINSGTGVITIDPGAEKLLGVVATDTLAASEAVILTYETTEGWW